MSRMKKRQIKKLARKLRHEPQDAIGLNTLMVPEAGRRLGRHEQKAVAHINAEWKHQREAFRASCMEVLGEDPDDWDLTPEEYEAKYAVGAKEK